MVVFALQWKSIKLVRGGVTSAQGWGAPAPRIPERPVDHDLCSVPTFRCAQRPYSACCELCEHMHVALFPATGRRSCRAVLFLAFVMVVACKARAPGQQ